LQSHEGLLQGVAVVEEEEEEEEEEEAEVAEVAEVEQEVFTLVTVM